MSISWHIWYFLVGSLTGLYFSGSEPRQLYSYPRRLAWKSSSTALKVVTPTSYPPHLTRDQQWTFRGVFLTGITQHSPGWTTHYSELCDFFPMCLSRFCSAQSVLSVYSELHGSSQRLLMGSGVIACENERFEIIVHFPWTNEFPPLRGFQMKSQWQAGAQHLQMAIWANGNQF